jgi:WD40 repeat protein
MLCSSGEDGRTLLWRVPDLVAAADGGSGQSKAGAGGGLTPAGSYANPQACLTRGALGPVPETTALAPDTRRGVLLAAAGDGVCYGWDVGEGRAAPIMRLQGHADALHCVTARVGCGQAVTGSEDGTARIWDCRAETCTQVIDVWRAKEAGAGASAGAWVGCVALDKDENWLAMGCGGRCITTWSFAAGACVSRVATAAAPQALVLAGEHLVAAGAEAAVYRWNLSGQVVSRQLCTPRSVFALGMQPHGRGLTAVAGAGACVDLFSELGSRVCKVTCA